MKLNASISTGYSSHAQDMLQVVEALNDLLAESTGLERACAASLEFVLNTTGRQVGAILVQSLSESFPQLIVNDNSTPAWEGQLGNPGSELRLLAQRILNTKIPGSPDEFPAWEQAGENTAFPIYDQSGLQGVLLIQGKPFTSEEVRQVMYLLRPIGRVIRISRANQAAQKHGLEMDAQKTAALEASHHELLRSRNTLRALFDSIPASLYIIDKNYKLVAINLSRAHRTGEAPKALVGRPCYEALYKRPDPCPGCQVAVTLLNGESTNRSERRYGTEEESMEWEISTYPIFDEAELVIQAILLEQDVTEKRRLESTLAQSEKLAAVGQLAAGVAHEINNPLTAIIANAQILQRELAPDDELQESVDLIARAGSRATQVVRNLLDFARKEQYLLADTDVNETIQKALALVQHELLSRGILLRLEPAPDLPLIQASHDHLQGVWLNLLMNAIDAINHNNGMIRITTRRTGDEIQTTIADNGKGISPENLSRIFEPFYTTKAPGRGTGLGLSVCHRVIKQHGGNILVESQVGIGTEFTILLPLP